MSLRGTIKRYILIIEQLNKNNYSTLDELKDLLHQEGFEISERTLQRDIEAIKNEFDIGIQYNKTRKGYHIEKFDTIHFESFLRFLEIANTAQFLIETMKEGKQAMEHISFDGDGMLTGSEHLKTLLEAIKEQKQIQFEHINFERNDKPKSYKIEPYLLKQYQNRWYVFGKVASIKEFRTFGLDRIQSLDISATKFKRDKNYFPTQTFDDIVGLNYSEGKMQTVRLSVAYPQAKYIKSLPLHHSQQIIKDDNKELVIELFLIPNFELLQKILMQGDFIKVVSPKLLADKMRSILKATLKNY